MGVAETFFIKMTLLDVENYVLTYNEWNDSREISFKEYNLDLPGFIVNSSLDNFEISIDKDLLVLWNAGGHAKSPFK